MKFFVKIPFQSGRTLYEMHTKEPYEGNDEQVKAWESAGYVEIVQGEEYLDAPTEAVEAFGTDDAPTDDFVTLTVEQLKKKYTADELKEIIANRGIEGDVEGKNKEQLINMIRGV